MSMKSAAENKLFSRKYSLNIRGRLLDLRFPCVMGVINVTPDSFFSGSRYQDERTILNSTERMLMDGAVMLDVGAYSSRPGAEHIAVETERDRACLAIKAIIKSFPSAVISIDTFRSEVAYAAIQEGASLINDISGGDLDPGMYPMLERLRVPYILMHMRGTPQTMAALNSYDNLLLDIIGSLQEKLSRLRSLNVHDVVVDPGFGFAKSISQNFKLLNNLRYFEVLECPLMVGISRKSMIWKTLGVSADDALNGTTVLNTVALLQGASILRVHDVKEAVEAIKLIGELKHVP